MPKFGSVSLVRAKDTDIQGSPVNPDVQLGEKSARSWKSSNFKQWRYQFSNKSQREIYVYQCEKPVKHEQKTHKGERKLTQKEQHP